MIKLRKSVVLFVMMSIFVLSGCSSFKAEPEIVTETGVLIEQAPNDEYDGTHLLVAGDQIFMLRSVSLNLSSGRYLGNKVQILGKPDGEILDVTGVSVVEVLVEEEVSAGELTSYANSDFGFKLSYFNDWTVAESIDSVVFESIDGDSVTIRQALFPYSPTLAEDGESDTPIQAYFLSEGFELSDFDSYLRLIGPDGLSALHFELPSGSEKYQLYRNGLVYTITFRPFDNLDMKRKNQFNSMIKSFRFTGFTVGDSDNPGVDIDGVPEVLVEEIIEKKVSAVESGDKNDEFASKFEMTSFESLPYKFGASYPASWYYAGFTHGDSGVLHHYAFSDSSVDDDNELLSLDVIAGSYSKGGKKTVAGRDLYVTRPGGNIVIHLSVADLNFRLSGPKAYEDLLVAMALSINSIER